MAPWPGLGPDSPLSRWVARRAGGHLAPRRLRLLTLGAALALGLGLVAALFAMQASSTPRFCGTCHVMKPYYDSWKHSSHNRIACVECHIPPGITAELRKKYEALSMVVRYFTGTYGTNPWAEVDDASCLRCHERRLLEGRESFHKVAFDHTPHLTEARRGLNLRCTSCHSQLVQGSHISVTSSTCALCHFKGQVANEGTGRCLTCHDIPERVTTTAGAAFDHERVRALDLDCRSCHGQVVRGDGGVPRERCLTCHNQAERLAEYGNPDLLHRRHVSDHKVDCMNCHLLIEHGRLPPPAAAHAAGETAAGAATQPHLVPAGASSCAACHAPGHGAQQNLYAGVGGRGVPGTPSPMYLAGVTCEGCHNPAFAQRPEDAVLPAMHTVRASEVSCMSCHGPSYQRIYRGWKRSMDERVDALRRQLDAAAAAMGADPPPAWGDARANFELVQSGRAVHNVNFSLALLEKAHEQMNEARRARGLGGLPLPWPRVAPASASCLSCHAGAERQSGSFAGRSFAHEPHLVAAGLDCSACHRPHAERAPGEVVRFGEAGCVPCHHSAPPTAAADCQRCHGDVMAQVLPSHRGPFSHKAHVDQGLECATCHQVREGDPRPDRATCAQCHEGG
jgi:predicted CXXCH cytochrome family protein